jgi:GMP synthase-like glutamine amidotransferase
MRVLVFQHIDVEHPGIFRDFLAEDGASWTAVECDAGETAPAFSGYDALWVMGGPMDVWQEDAFPWLKSEKDAIGDWVAGGRPVLGVCLGHQLLADALGGSVAPMAAPEVGVLGVSLSDDGTRDPLFAGLPAEAPCLQWHGSEVAALPDGAVALAASPACACQAFRIGENAYGLQYHVEATERTIPEWAAVPEYAASLEAVMGAGAVARFDAEVASALPEFNRLARRLYDNFKRLL